MIRAKTLASLGLLTILCAAFGQSQNNKAELIPIKYDELKQEVFKHRGKVLVVDFWAGT